jgi:Domain of unknown function (DUF1772)
MHVLDTITIALAGLMAGNELAVTAFFNPAVWQLESTPQAQALSILARTLGRVMPVWYGLCLALLGLETYLRRREAAFIPLLTAALIWAAVIIFSISMLVPINNRIASLRAGANAGANVRAPIPGWKQDHKRWDSLHRVRVLLLLVALLTLIHGLLA